MMTLDDIEHDDEPAYVSLSKSRPCAECGKPVSTRRERPVCLSCLGVNTKPPAKAEAPDTGRPPRPCVDCGTPVEQGPKGRYALRCPKHKKQRQNEWTRDSKRAARARGKAARQKAQPPKPAPPKPPAPKPPPPKCYRPQIPVHLL